MKAPFIKDTAAKLQRAAEDFQATEQQIRELQESRLARLLDAGASEIDARSQDCRSAPCRTSLP
jgi:hypothetical protein